MSEEIIKQTEEVKPHVDTIPMIEIKNETKQEQAPLIWYNSPSLVLGTFIIGAFIVGFIKYCWLVTTKNLKYKWFNALVSASVSSVSGLIAGSMIMYMGWNMYLGFMLIGISGWMGVAFIEVVESVFMQGLLDRFKSALYSFVTYNTNNNNKEDKEEK